MGYLIKKVESAPAMDCNWEAPCWQAAETAELTYLRPESSDHHPVVKVKVLHDDANFYGIYKVEDRYVVAVQDGFQAPVCNDSCVEIFFKPNVGPGYFNLEMSAGGAYLMFYIRNHQRTEDGFVDYTPVAPEHGKLVTVKTSLPHRVWPEMTGPVTWYAQFTIPLATIEPYCGKIGKLSSGDWKGNFFKCADQSSHPHWLTWRPLTVLNYHLPECFDTFTLA